MIGRAEREAQDRAKLGDRAVLDGWRYATAMSDVERAIDQLLEIDMYLGELRRNVATRVALRATRGQPQRFEAVLAGTNADYHMTKQEQGWAAEAIAAKQRLERHLLGRNGYELQRCEPIARSA